MRREALSAKPRIAGQIGPEKKREKGHKVASMRF